LTLLAGLPLVNTMEEKTNKINENSLLKQDKTRLQGISLSMLPNLMHNLPGMAYRCKNDSQWSMIFISEGCADLTGYHVNDLIDNASLSYDDVILEADRQMVHKLIGEAVQARTQFQLEYRISCRDGATKWVWEQGNAVYDSDHNPVFLDGLIIDVTSRHSTEEELKQAAAELLELNATKDRFFSLVAHDLRNPVYSIISLSEFVAGNYGIFGQAQIEDAFLQVNSAACGILTLLENLLDWAKLQTGQMLVQKEFVSLSQTIGYAIKHYQKNSIQKGIEIVFDHQDDCMVESDVRMLSSIFRNLISNAVKYSGPQSKITVQLKMDSSCISVSVKDQGIGIPRQNLQNIFRIDNEFRQYGTANESGSGLGLILVDNFTRLLGGQIRVESKLNHGTKFTLTLPGRI